MDVCFQFSQGHRCPKFSSQLKQVPPGNDNNFRAAWIEQRIQARNSSRTSGPASISPICPGATEFDGAFDWWPLTMSDSRSGEVVGFNAEEHESNSNSESNPASEKVALETPPEPCNQ